MAPARLNPAIASRTTSLVATMFRSVKFVLGTGVGALILAAVGLVGILGTLGSMRSALEISARLQDQRTAAMSDNVHGLFEQVEWDALALAELLQTASDGLDDERVIALFSAFIRHTPAVTDLSLVRKDGSNLMVWHEDDGEVDWERDGDLSDDAIDIAVEGRPGDGSEGFEDLYLEPEDRRPVISYTIHLVDEDGDPSGTLFLDMDLGTMSEELVAAGEGQAGYSFVFDSAGRVLAHPSLIGRDAYAAWPHVPTFADIEDAVALAVAERVLAAGPSFQDITVAGTDWLLSIAAIDDVGDSTWYAVDAVPRDAVLGQARDRAIVIAVIGGVTLLLAVGLAVWVGRSISRPITRLSLAAKNVEQLNLEVPAKRQPLSSFSDIRTAEKAFAAMLRGLEVFARYVPRNLVRQLIRLEERGGDIAPAEHEVTILFTDIAGYSSISEGMRPSDLAGMLNDYFEAIVLPIMGSDGTVDKFIGDAIMAFWNAPVRQADHADRALAAALEIRKVSARLNAERQAAGAPALVTRIGVHTGTALVGNIGSKDRMNYTIIGDAVNTTARLEALGKEVGETLCISGETRAAATEAYAWREIGRVELRGRSSETTVFTIDP